MKYTKGKWSIYDDWPNPQNAIIIMGWDEEAEESFDIANVLQDGIPDEEMEANCNLIAAAPDMLEALEEVVLFLEPRAGSFGMHAVHKAKAVIAKAKGEA